jgi:hypothetical protein
MPELLRWVICTPHNAYSSSSAGARRTSPAAPVRSRPDDRKNLQQEKDETLLHSFTMPFEPNLMFLESALAASGMLIANNATPPPLAAKGGGEDGDRSLWVRALLGFAAVRHIAGSSTSPVEPTAAAELLAEFVTLTRPYATSRARNVSWVWEAALNLLETSVLPDLAEIGKENKASPSMLQWKAVTAGIRVLFAQQQFQHALAVGQRLLDAFSTTRCPVPLLIRAETCAIVNATELALVKFNCRAVQVATKAVLDEIGDVSTIGAVPEYRELADVLCVRLFALQNLTEKDVGEAWFAALKDRKENSSEVKLLLPFLRDSGSLDEFIKLNELDNGRTTLLRSTTLAGEILLRRHKKKHSSTVEEIAGSSLSKETVAACIKSMTWVSALTAVASRHNPVTYRKTLRRLLSGNYHGLMGLQKAADPHSILEVVVAAISSSTSLEASVAPSTESTWIAALSQISNIVTLGSLPTGEQLRKALLLSAEVERDMETIAIFDTLRQREAVERLSGGSVDHSHELSSTEVLAVAEAVRRQGMWRRAVDVLASLAQCTPEGGMSKATILTLSETMSTLGRAWRWVEAIHLMHAMPPETAVTQVQEKFLMALRHSPGQTWLRALQHFPLSEDVNPVFVAQLMAVRSPESALALIQRTGRPSYALTGSLALGGWPGVLEPMVASGLAEPSHLFTAMAHSASSVSAESFMKAAATARTPNDFSMLVRLGRRYGHLKHAAGSLNPRNALHGEMSALCVFLSSGRLSLRNFTLPFVARTILHSGIPFEGQIKLIKLPKHVNLQNWLGGCSIIQRSDCTLLRHVEVSPQRLDEILFVSPAFSVVRKPPNVPLGSLAAAFNKSQKLLQVPLFQVPDSCGGLCVLISTDIPTADVFASFSVALVATSVMVRVAPSLTTSPADDSEPARKENEDANEGDKMTDSASMATAAQVLKEQFSVIRHSATVLPTGHVEEKLSIRCHTLLGSGVEQRSALLTEAVRLLRDNGWRLEEEAEKAKMVVAGADVAVVWEISLVIGGVSRYFSLYPSNLNEGK